jgi:hypothetical protein
VILALRAGIAIGIAQNQHIPTSAPTAGRICGRITMEFESPEIVNIKPGEPLLVINKNASPVEVGSAITFKQDGVYLVTVKGKQIIIEKWKG